jgi:hypothetical protein
MATWANTTLCTLDDIRTEVSDLQLPLQVGGTTGELEDKAATKITLAKSQLKTKLLVALQPRFAVSASVHYASEASYNPGYSWSELDTMMDKISNPEALLPVAVAFTIRAMLMDAQLAFRANYQSNEELLTAALTRWEMECKVRLSDAVALLQFDLDENGTVDDTERPATDTTFFRV